MRRETIKTAAKGVAATLILIGILAAASEGSAIVNLTGLAVAAGGFWMGSKIFQK